MPPINLALVEKIDQDRHIKCYKVNIHRQKVLNHIKMAGDKGRSMFGYHTNIL